LVFSSKYIEYALPILFNISKIESFIKYYLLIPITFPIASHLMINNSIIYELQIYKNYYDIILEFAFLTLTYFTYFSYIADNKFVTKNMILTLTR
jgi:hypothetical protein